MHNTLEIIEAELNFVFNFFQQIDPCFEFCIYDINLNLLYGEDTFVSKKLLSEKIKEQKNEKDTEFFLDTAFVFSLEFLNEKLYFALYSYHPVLNEFAKKLLEKFIKNGESLQKIKNLTLQQLQTKNKADPKLAFAEIIKIIS